MLALPSGTPVSRIKAVGEGAVEVPLGVLLSGIKPVGAADMVSLPSGRVGDRVSASSRKNSVGLAEAVSVVSSWLLPFEIVGIFEFPFVGNNSVGLTVGANVICTGLVCVGSVVVGTPLPVVEGVNVPLLVLPPSGDGIGPTAGAGEGTETGEEDGASSSLGSVSPGKEADGLKVTVGLIVAAFGEGDGADVSLTDDI